MMDEEEKKLSLEMQDKQFEQERILEGYRAQNQRVIEQFKSTSQVTAMTLKSAMLINGGAAIALITFIGNVDPTKGVDSFICALQYYIVGVFLVTIATGMSYLSDNSYLKSMSIDRETTKLSISNITEYIAILLVIFSYGAFIAGSNNASNGFTERANHMKPKIHSIYDE